MCSWITRAKSRVVPPPRTTDAPPAESGLADPAGFRRDLRPQPLLRDDAPATGILYERLSPGELAEAEALLRSDAEASFCLDDAANAVLRRYVLLAFGLLLESHTLIERTGLPTAQPPDGVHSVARGHMSAAGGIFEADMIAAALQSAGVDPVSLGSALDFGCSSGRVVRVLAAAYPQVTWHGCDPNEGAIGWAAGALPHIHFFKSSDHPPLGLEEGSLDMAFAISVWSHFEPMVGLAWLREMRRLVRPGGHLVLTTHGFTTLDFQVTRGQRQVPQAEKILLALYRYGFWYKQEFGAEGDWGITNPDWGTAFLTSEWLITQIRRDWRLVEFAPGRNQDNQDLYVLQRL